MFEPKASFRVATKYQPLMREVGLDADGIFKHPQIVSWRKLPDRENCTLDASLSDGQFVRLHIKRYQPTKEKITPAEMDIRGHALLEGNKIPTLTMVGWGQLSDGRSFSISENLTGYEPSDKAIRGGAPFDRLVNPIIDLAAKLHGTGLHHRDLYLCHFFVKTEGDAIDVRLIDTARVKHLPRFFSRRWIVKDLAQLWYSTLPLPISDEQRKSMLRRYALQRHLNRVDTLYKSILSKVKKIARHDAKLNKNQPTRNVSLTH